MFTKLYEALIALEREIEESLPQFQELVLTLSHNDQPTKEASISRKRLLEAFAQYNALAKRIRRLPSPPGSSVDQVQASIMNRVDLFLLKNMFLSMVGVLLLLASLFPALLCEAGLHAIHPATSTEAKQQTWSATKLSFCIGTIANDSNASDAETVKGTRRKDIKRSKWR
ncbi:hypothetical protein DXG01_016046 [Tephrocybe rancida]|nr:hypothetical protein DXG01_016046 [Tephrocybe rancida]